MIVFSRYQFAFFCFWAVAFLPCFLGGAVQLNHAGWLLFVEGLLLIWIPPQHRLQRRAVAALGLLAVIPLLSFLPLGHLLGGAWRMAWKRDQGVDLGWLITAQPWLTLEAVPVFFAAWLFLWGRLADPSPKEERVSCVSVLGLTVGGVAGLALLQYFWRPLLPGWNEGMHTGFGCFPNRNQFGNLLFMGGLFALASSLQRRRSIGWKVLHGSALLLILVALIVNTSRGGLLFFFIGSIGWSVWVAFSSRSLQKSGRVAAVLMILVALFLVFGGHTLDRILAMRRGDASGGGGEVGFRWLIAKDVLSMVAAMPWLGTGVGNFASIFPLFRHFSESPGWAIHPDSDLLWILAECGILGTVVIVVAIGLILSLCRMVHHDSIRNLQVMALVAVGCFLLHSLIDVSGHRLETLFPALMILGVALPAPVGKELRPAAEWVRVVWRCLAGSLAVIGLIWALDSNQSHGVMEKTLHISWPTGAKAERLQQEADIALKAHSYVSAEVAASAGLRIEPLFWRLYFDRALSRFGQEEKRSEARADFAQARFLVPHRIEIRLTEASLWLPIRPLLALEINREGLAIAGDKADFYDQVLAQGFGNPFLRLPLLSLADDDIGLTLVYLSYATPAEAAAVFGHLLAIDPQLRYLGPPQLHKVLQRWSQIGNLPDLVARIELIPEWESEGWLILAQYQASKGNYRAAFAEVQRHDPLPPLPTLTSGIPLGKLAVEARLHPDQVDLQVTQFIRERQDGNQEVASVILRQLSARADCPHYLFYYLAQERAVAGFWEEAWRLYVRYRSN